MEFQTKNLARDFKDLDPLEGIKLSEIPKEAEDSDTDSVTSMPSKVPKVGCDFSQ